MDWNLRNGRCKHFVSKYDDDDLTSFVVFDCTHIETCEQVLILLDITDGGRWNVRHLDSLCLPIEVVWIDLSGAIVWKNWGLKLVIE